MWKTRWLVIDTRSWLSERKVVIPPSAIAQMDYERNEIRVTLTKAQIEASPDISANEPVSRQLESGLCEYYGWDPYWGSSYFIPGAMASSLSSAPYFGSPLASEGPIADPDNLGDGDAHLRSVAEVAGYHLQAADGPIGHVENFYIDDGSWEFRYLIADTRNGCSGGEVLLGPVAICVGIRRRVLGRHEAIRSCGEVNDLIVWFLGESLPSVDLAHGDLS